MEAIYPNGGILGEIYNRTQDLNSLERISKTVLVEFLNGINDSLYFDYTESQINNLVCLKNYYVYNSVYLDYFF